MIARVQTSFGVFSVDLDEEEVLGLDADAQLVVGPAVEVALPRVVAAAAVGAIVVAVVDAKPPLLVSHDAGATWNESGRGLPAGRAVAIAGDDPDVVVYAARNRLYVSRDGGRFWYPLPVELPEITGVALDPT